MVIEQGETSSSNRSTETNSIKGTAPSILQILCQNFGGVLVDTKTIREHWLKPLLSDLLAQKFLMYGFNNQASLFP